MKLTPLIVCLLIGFVVFYFFCPAWTETKTQRFLGQLVTSHQAFGFQHEPPPSDNSDGAVYSYEVDSVRSTMASLGLAFLLYILSLPLLALKRRVFNHGVSS